MEFPRTDFWLVFDARPVPATSWIRGCHRRPASAVSKPRGVYSPPQRQVSLPRLEAPPLPRGLLAAKNRCPKMKGPVDPESNLSLPPVLWLGSIVARYSRA